MKHIELLEKAVKVQRRLDGLGLDVLVAIGYVKLDCIESYLLLRTLKNDGFVSTNNNDSIETIIQIAKDLVKPKYIKLKGICVDSIGSTVYVKENEIYKPLELAGMTKDGVMLSDGGTYSADDVYVEE